MLGIVNLSLLSQWLTNVSASPRLFWKTSIGFPFIRVRVSPPPTVRK